MLLKVGDLCRICFREPLTEWIQYLGRFARAVSRAGSDFCWLSRDWPDRGISGDHAQADQGQESNRQMFLAEKDHWLGL